MLNMKKYYQSLLSSSQELAEALGANGEILSAYPDEVTKFPVVIYEDNNQRDIEYSDNLPWGTGASVRIHIFTKAVAGFPTTYALGRIIADLFRADYWNCGINTELSENDNIKHRVMDFSREFYSR